MGIVFDQKLTYKYHIAKAAKKGIKAALLLKQLKNLKLETFHQLFISMVASVVNYTLPIWILGKMQTFFYIFDIIQRIGAQAVIKSFYTIAQCIAELKVGIKSANSWYYNQQQTV